MSTCFIADLHLSVDQPEGVERFLRFLDEEAIKHKDLYILGDLFEVWLGDDLSTELYLPVLQALQHTVAQGTAIYVQHGNRDFLLGSQFEQRSGCQLISDPCLVQIDDQRVLLTHGDTLCSGDHSYQKYRKWIRNPFTLWVLRHLPQTVRRRIGHALRQRSDSDKRQKSVSIMDVTQQTAEEMMQQWQCDTLIHGHTHRPGIHPFTLNGQHVQRLVLGDWDSHNSSNILTHEAGVFIQLQW